MTAASSSVRTCSECGRSAGEIVYVRFGRIGGVLSGHRRRNRLAAPAGASQGGASVSGLFICT
jgi:hypothetical protein